MSLHRCELAEALLYSPVKVALHDAELLALHRLLALDSAAALDERGLLEQERGRWPTARSPAGLSASIAAWVWPRFCAQHVARLDAAVAVAQHAIRWRQAASGRDGALVLRRDTGEVTAHLSDALVAGQVFDPLPEWVVARLSRLWTREAVRGLLLGPLDAWPV